MCVSVESHSQKLFASPFSFVAESIEQQAQQQQKPNTTSKKGRFCIMALVEAPVYRSKSGKNDKKIVNFVVSGNCFCVWGWDEGVEVPPAALRVNHPTLRRCQVANHASGGLCVGVMR